MIAMRSFCIISFLLLTACGHRSVVTQSPLSPETPPLEAAKKAPTDVIQPLAKGQTPTQTAELSPKSRGARVGEPRTAGAASQITSWNISGAMAARTKNKGWSVSIHWIQQGPGQYQIRLSGPLGSGTILITRSGGTVTLRDGAKTVTSSSAESLLKQQTGISLPVPNLYYWVRGIPAPGPLQTEKRDSAGRLVLLRQVGYTIQYPQYTSASGAAVPSHIRLQGNGIFIKLVIKKWGV